MAKKKSAKSAKKKIQKKRKAKATTLPLTIEGATSDGQKVRIDMDAVGWSFEVQQPSEAMFDGELGAGEAGCLTLRAKFLEPPQITYL